MTKNIFKGSAMLNPVPAVLITSKNSKGDVNVFTVGWIGTVCTKPPMISVGIRPERLSYDYIKETREFVVNLPTKKMIKAVDFCGVRSGTKIDKIKKFGFKLTQSKTINVPIIDNCPVALECVVKDIIPLGSHHLFLAEIQTIQVDENLIDEKGKIHYENADLISYCHGEYFPLPKKPTGKFGFSVKKRSKNK